VRADPAGAVEMVHGHFDLPMTDEHRARSGIVVARRGQIRGKLKSCRALSSAILRDLVADVDERAPPSLGQPCLDVRLRRADQPGDADGDGQQRDCADRQPAGAEPGDPLPQAGGQRWGRRAPFAGIVVRGR